MKSRLVVSNVMVGANRPVTPSIIARLLHVHYTTVLLWITKKGLAALDISTQRSRPSYQVYRDDLFVFLTSRGMTEERFRQVFAHWYPRVAEKSRRLLS